MPPLILSPSFNSTGSISAPPNLTISGIMSAASGVFSGNVGIGMTPSMKLDITTSTLLDGLQLSDGTRYLKVLAGTVGTGSYNGIVQANDTAFIFSAGTSGSGNFVIAPWMSSGLSGMRMTSSGNVGIGTTSPGNNLTVSGSTSNQASIGAVHSGTGTFDCSANIYNSQPTAAVAAGILRVWSSNQLSNNLILNCVNSTTEVFRVQSDGFIQNNSIPALSMKTQSDNVGGCTFQIDATTSGTNANSRLAFLSSGVTKWYIINSASNSYRLYINDADGNDGVYMAQNTTAWVANSDLRIKDVQGTITNALDKIQQLTGVKFKWKRDSDNPDAKVRVGLIAQDVQAVLPEAVDDESPDLITDEETGRVSGGLGVRYTELVPLLVNAIKELTARVVALESQLSSGAA